MSSTAFPRIGILGSGRMATAVAAALRQAGHEVCIGSSDPLRARAAAMRAGTGIEAGDYAHAATFGDILAIAALWEQIPRIIRAAGSLRGRVLMDITNPELPDGLGLVIGHSTSGAEQIAAWSGARVVKCLNHIYAEVLDQGTDFGGKPASALYCGDDVTAKAEVKSILSRMRLDPIDAGPLSSARLLEPTAALMVVLVRRQGFAPGDIALQIGRRDRSISPLVAARFPQRGTGVR